MTMLQMRAGFPAPVTTAFNAELGTSGALGALQREGSTIPSPTEGTKPSQRP